MDINVAHDIIHDNFGSSENCPVCKGTITGKSAVVKEATRIAEERQKRNNSMRFPMMLNEKENKMYSVVELFEADDKEIEPPSEIMIMPVGKFQTTKYGSVEITEKDIDVMVKNFNSKVRAGVPIDTDHDGGMSNGWIKKLIDKGKQGLWASVEWTTEGKDKLGKKLYRFMSPEFSLNHRDPLTSKAFGATLLAGTLTNRPLFRQMPAIVANEYDKLLTEGLTNDNLSIIIIAEDKKDPQLNMNITEIVAKDLKDLSADEKDFLTANKDRLSFDEKVKFELATKEEIEANEVDKKKKEEEEAKKKELEKKNMKANDKDEVSIKATELAELKANAEAGIKAKEEMAKMKFTEEAEALLFTDKGGKVAPAGKDALVNLLMSFSDEQRANFDEVMKAVPEKNMFSEIGTGGEGENSHLTIAQQVDKLIDEKLKANEGMTYSEAQKLVFSEKPELEKNYQAEVAEANKITN